MRNDWLFGGRQKKSGDNGSDFEDFVLECFRIAKDERTFSTSLRRGRDGAIDLVDRHGAPGSTVIAECKYIGTGGFREARSEWKKVLAHLVDYLPALSEDGSRNAGSPYRGWIDPASPVSRYRFCVTVSLTDQEVNRLEQEIAADFATLADRGVAELRPLANTPGAVRVLSWDWFHRLLADNPPLTFRWFRGLPIGVNLFDAAGRRGQSFRDFLSGATLPYFSRDAFFSKASGSAARGESGLVADLVAGKLVALVLAGPGGVGKTRLAHELAVRMSEEAAGYDAYWLDRSASGTSVHELAARYPDEARLLLLVDYAEAAQRLAEIADAAAYLIDQGGHRVAIVATCRASATNRVGDDLDVLHPEIRSLASPLNGEDAYLAWVTRSILDLEPFPHADRVAAICRQVPALAAFAVYLFRRDREQFDAQFGALLVDDNFRNWSTRRIAALVQGASGSERALAEIALALPIASTAKYRARQRYGDLLDRLIADRWIEQSGGNYEAAHDILADTLLARWVFETDTSATERIAALLVDAAAEDGLASALIVLGRLATHAAYPTIDGRRVLETIGGEAPAQTTDAVGVIIASPMFAVPDKLDLIATTPEIAAAIATRPDLGDGLARLVHQATHLLKTVPLAIPAVIGDLLDAACARTDSSNFILRRAFALLPDRFRARALDSIARYPVDEQTHFLVVQMLRTGEPPATMENAVRTWLEVNGGTHVASFVFRAWLDAGGDQAIIREHLLRWIDARGTILEAQYVYRAWLQRRGDATAVRQPLLRWIEAHGLRESAEFVYQAWLDATGDRETVRVALLRWTALHGLRFDASYVYMAWLGQGGEWESIGEAISAWLDVHGLLVQAHAVHRACIEAHASPRIMALARDWIARHGDAVEAGAMFASWLTAGHDPAAVREPLRAWLLLHGDRQEADRVFGALLQSRIEGELVAERLPTWLAAHRAAFATRFLYQTWLEIGGDKDVIVDPLLAWLDDHHLHALAEPLFKTWFDTGGAIEVLEAHLTRWTLRWYKTEQFVFLSKTLSNRTDLPEPIVLAIADWAMRYPENEDSLWRLGRLLSRQLEGRLSFEGFSALLACIGRIVAGLRRPTMTERLQIWGIVASLASAPLFNINPQGALRLVETVVAAGTVFDPSLTDDVGYLLAVTPSRICHITVLALHDGMLAAPSARDGLSRLAAWLESYGRDPQERARLAAKLRRAMPH